MKLSRQIKPHQHYVSELSPYFYNQRMRKADRIPTVLDLFAGAGGFSLGFHWAGFKPTVAIDFNPLAIQTLESNFGHLGVKVLQRNLSSFTPKDLKEHLLEQGLSAKFDVIIGGPPCQGWSKVGRGKLRSLKEGSPGFIAHHDSRNELYHKLLGFVREFQPRVAVMENVPGMLSHDGKNVAESVASSLEGIGYRVTWSLMNASDFGVPQHRHRLIFVGVRIDHRRSFVFPKTLAKSGRRAFPTVTLTDAIGDLPIIRNGSQEWVREYKPPKSKGPFLKKMRMGADRGTIFDHVCRTQNDQDLQAFRFMRQGGKYADLPKRFKRYRDDIFKDKYRKLRWDEPSGCVTAHLGKDCYTHIHPSQARTISVREAARIQSFPDNFFFGGSMGSKFTLIGNAVPPVLSENIAIAIKQQLFPSANPAADRESPVFTTLPTHLAELAIA
ncbi:MAG: DNA cytosine methyltransferase [Elusimicrobia bacterium]|nr:DNA cytosine methyltransferase [Elusimicrobiota bacterium]